MSKVRRRTARAFGARVRLVRCVGIAVGTAINFTAGEMWIFRGDGR